MYVVYVISETDKPLMPTTRFGKVKRLLKNKLAKVVCRKPFTIKLLYSTPEIVQELTMGIDPGAKHIGLSVRKEDGEPIFLAELDTRTTDIAGLMEERKQHRQARRAHSREKQKRRAVQCGTVFSEKEYTIKGCDKPITCKRIKPGKIKFSNRLRADKWHTPTCSHLLSTHINFISKVAKILPITSVHIEYAKFDIQKINNPDITGVAYQNGRMRGYTNLTDYVLCRDAHVCKLCGVKNKELQVHHVVWRRVGGSDLPENLVTLCALCHSKVHSHTKTDLKVKDLFAGNTKKYTSTTILNAIMPALYKWLTDKFNNVAITYGYETKDKRRKCNLPKAHWVDAYLISCDEDVSIDISKCESFKFKQFRRHNRAIIKRQEDRNYYFEGKRVASNRSKRTAQSLNSLKELVQEKGLAILNQLKVKLHNRAYRSIKEFKMGDIVLFDKSIEVVKGFTGNYLGFIGKEKYNHPMKNAKLMVKNQGIVCIC